MCGLLFERSAGQMNHNQRSPGEQRDAPEGNVREVESEVPENPDRGAGDKCRDYQNGHQGADDKDRGTGAEE